jgi:hypothetical protein
LEYHITGRVHVPYTPFTNMVPVLNWTTWIWFMDS